MSRRKIPTIPHQETRNWQGIVANDPPWERHSYAAISAQADRMLAERQRAFPALIDNGTLTVEDAESELRIWTIIAGDWHWIATGEGERAEFGTLAARRAAMDSSLARIAEHAREYGGFTDKLNEMANLLIAMRWHLEPAQLNRERNVYWAAEINRELRKTDTEIPDNQRSLAA